MKESKYAPPKVTLGQYKDLPVTRRVRPVSEKAVELETRNLAETMSACKYSMLSCTTVQHSPT